jgi:hypothetical protein
MINRPPLDDSGGHKGRVHDGAQNETEENNFPPPGGVFRTA